MKSAAGKTRTQLLEENERLRAELAKVREVLRAIGQGEVDGGVVSGTRRQQVSSLAGADSFGAFSCDCVTGQVFCTSERLALDGLPADGVVRPDENSVPKAVCPEDKSRFLAQFLAAQDPHGSGILDVEYRIMRADGQIRWLRAHGKVVFSNDRRPVRCDGIVQDVTDRKRAELALDRQRTLLASVMQATDVMLVYLDRDFNFVWVNAAYAATCNMRPDEMIGKNHFALYPSDENKAIFCRVCDTGVPVFYKDKPFEFPDQPERGVTYWDWSLVPVKSAPDDIQGLVFSLRETTKYKQAELALRASEERFRQVAEMVSDFVWETDADGLYTYTSPSVEKILGYAPDEIAGKMHFYDLFVPDAREELKAAALGAFAARKRFEAFTNSNLSKTGKVVYLETSGIPVVNEAGVLLGYRGTDTDVTDRRRAEMETQLLRQELALFSRVATMGELTASIAHELYQPLTAILSNAEAAQCLIECETPDLKQLRSILDDIVADDQRAADVIRSMRSMLRKGAGEYHALLLNQLIMDIVPIVRKDAILKKVSVVLDLGSPMPPVEGDRIQLEQVALNLAVNALEAMDASEGVRELVFRTRHADNEVMLDVIDSGCGILPNTLNSIFEPFFTTKKTGLGMGLPLSRSIVIAHKGRLWAENNAAGGATFHMALPAAVATEPLPSGGAQ